LVAVETAIVEACIRVADRYSQGRPGSIGQVVIDEVQVVSTKVGVSEGSPCWDWITGWTTAGGTGVERGRYGQHRCVKVIVGAGGRSASRIMPDDVDTR